MSRCPNGTSTEFSRWQLALTANDPVVPFFDIKKTPCRNLSTRAGQLLVAFDTLRSLGLPVGECRTNVLTFAVSYPTSLVITAEFDAWFLTWADYAPNDAFESDGSIPDYGLLDIHPYYLTLIDFMAGARI